MWAAFKLLPGATKFALVAIVIAAFLLAIGATSYVAYNKGVTVAAVQLERWQTASQRIQAVLAKKRNKVDQQIHVEYIDRNIYLDRVVTETKTIVRESVPQQFTFSNGWVYAYNQTVKGEPVDPTLASDTTPASVTDVEALAGTIIPNNGVCLANQNQLDTLQKWIRETEQARKEAVNEK